MDNGCQEYGIYYQAELSRYIVRKDNHFTAINKHVSGVDFYKSKPVQYNFCWTYLPAKIFPISYPIFSDGIGNNSYMQTRSVIYHSKPESSAFWWYLFSISIQTTRKDSLIQNDWIHTVSSFLTKSAPRKLGCTVLSDDFATICKKYWKVSK